MKPIKFHFKHPEESSGYLLWQVTMKWQKQMNRSLQELNMTHTQFVILASLAWLEDKKDLVTQVDISQNSQTDRMMVSKVLRTLEQKSLIIRKEHPQDSRAKCVTLSEKGRQILQQAIHKVEATDRDFFATLAHPYNFNREMIGLMNA